MIRVVCAIIIKDDKVFICRRSANKSLAGYWEFPGGKVESGEKEKDSLTRELMEELQMKVTVGSHFKTVIHDYENITIKLISYKCVIQEADFVMTDHDKFDWIEPKKLLEFNLAPADIPIAEELTKTVSTTGDFIKNSGGCEL